MPQVQFTVDASTAKAVREIIKITAAEQRMEQAANRAANSTTKSAEQQALAYRKLGSAASDAAAKISSAHRKAGGVGGGGGGGFGRRFGEGLSGAGSGIAGSLGVGGIMGLGGGLAAAAGSIGAVAGAYLKFRDELLQTITDDSMKAHAAYRPLLSLGDNLKHPRDVRETVQAYAATMGRPIEEVSSGMFNLQSATGSFSEQKRAEVLAAGAKMTNVAGGDLPTNLNLVAKLMNIYGSSVKNAADMSDKLFAIMDHGAITQQELAEHLPDLAAAAAALDIPLDSAGAALIVTTQQMGKAETAAVALRNILLKMPQAVEKGLIQGGSLESMFRQIAKLNPKEVDDLFGERSFAAAGALSSHASQFESERKQLQNLPKGVLKAKATLQWSDPTQATAMAMAAAKQGRENDAEGRTEDKNLQRAALLRTYNQRGAAILNPNSPKWFQDALAWGEKGNSFYAKAAWKASMKEAVTAKDEEYQDFLKVRMAESAPPGEQLAWKDAKGRHVMGRKEYDEFMGLHKAGIGITPELFEEYKTRRGHGDKERAFELLQGAPRLPITDPSGTPKGFKLEPQSEGSMDLQPMIDHFQQFGDYVVAFGNAVDSAKRVNRNRNANVGG